MKQTKRQIFPSGLWVVATPIGNLSDFSPRGVQALEEADFILCEDTRRTAVLLSALKISVESRLSRLDAHALDSQIHHWIDKLKEGMNVALVSDAGTPAISDPGAKLVSQAHEQGVRVTPVPGASAVLTLLSVAGFDETSFAFHGFFPRVSTRAWTQALDQLQSLVLNSEQLGITAIPVHLWFESPHRIRETFLYFQERFPEVAAVCGKELTKIHEKIFRGTVQQVCEWIQNEIQAEGEVGEWCFALCFARSGLNGQGAEAPDAENSEGSGQSMAQETAVKQALQCLLECGVSVSEAARKVSQIFGVKKKSIYTFALQISDKKSGEGG